MRCTGVLYRRTEDTGQSFLSIRAIGSRDIDRATRLAPATGLNHEGHGIRHLNSEVTKTRLNLETVILPFTNPLCVAVNSVYCALAAGGETTAAPPLPRRFLSSALS